MGCALQQQQAAHTEQNVLAARLASVPRPEEQDNNPASSGVSDSKYTAGLMLAVQTAMLGDIFTITLLHVQSIFMLHRGALSPLGRQQPPHPKRPFITFTGEQAEGNFNHLVVDERTGHIYLGAVNRIYKLSSDLKVLVTHETGPDDDNPKCYPPRIVQTCNEPLTPTNNINKMLLIDYKENRLIACGSLYQGICKLLRLDDLFKLGEPFHKKEHYLSGVNESGSVFGVIVSYSNMDDKLFIATAVDGKPEYFPTISSRKLTKNSEADGMFAYVFHDEFVASMIKIPSDTFTIIPDFDIYYIYGFSSGNFVYFLTLQPEMISPPGSTTKEQVYTSKLVRLCKEDTAFNSYVEVPIGCEKNGVEYRLLQAAYLSKAGAILARSLGVGPEDDILFTVFSKGQKRKMKSLDESALCIFVLKNINDRIKDRLQSCYRGEGTLDLAWLKVKDIPCSSAAQLPPPPPISPLHQLALPEQLSIPQLLLVPMCR
ncbi:hypothetical protein IHE44_0012667 [Lamprotornis superbus]|uniref:Sema domain-containing protein n=1 Tax=Lamprotornis superbus TaxID=245042 RepID=A0A835NKD2_9PASS|nr:hypothetical protein IHE44_0012667 [Lamprotornis superbus]